MNLTIQTDNSESKHRQLFTGVTSFSWYPNEGEALVQSALGLEKIIVRNLDYFKITKGVEEDGV